MTPQTPNTHWRDDAINAALQIEAEEGSSEDALLRAIRIQHPNYATRLQYLNRERMTQFLEACCPDFKSVLKSEDVLGDEDNQVLRYTGWFVFDWQGASIEIALTPSGYDTDYVVGFSADSIKLGDLFSQLVEYSIRPPGRCLRYSQGWENARDLDEEIGKVSWDDLVLAPGDMKNLRETAENFFAQKDVFHALGFAWRRGLLLVGPPGTGKTTVCKAVATALPDLPFLYVRDLHERNQREAIKTIFKRARKLAPCILVFEDIDGFITDHNRSVFLNEMDGFQSNDGLLVIASSNHPGKIDEALLKRPSRFDRVFHIGLPKKPERIEYCRRILSRTQMSQRIADSLDREALARQVGDKTDGFTPAYLKEVFTSAALSRAQDGATVLDDHFADAVMRQVEELRAHLKRAKDPDALAAMNGGSEVVGFRR
ncbi:MAG TPA: ATP-binding protein [Abditibacteriaceae bacterium]|nr:ATP-binding protein [Abditibacteriaceae bacterium]